MMKPSLFLLFFTLISCLNISLQYKAIETLELNRYIAGYFYYLNVTIQNKSKPIEFLFNHW